jgi:hypothetical protein
VFERPREVRDFPPVSDLRELVEAMEAVLAEAEVKRSTMMPEEAEEVLVVWDSRQESQTLASRQRRLFDVRPQ